MDKTIFCYTCNAETGFEVKIENIETEMGGIRFTYNAVVAYCGICGQEVSVPEINDLNIIHAYQKHKEILESGS